MEKAPLEVVPLHLGIPSLPPDLHQESCSANYSLMSNGGGQLWRIYVSGAFCEQTSF